MRDYRKGEEKWTQGIVVEKTGPVSYRINVGVPGVWKRHVDQMLTRPDPELQQTAVNLPIPEDLPPGDICTTLHSNTPHTQEPDCQISQHTQSPHQSTDPPQAVLTGTPVTETMRRYPVRITKPPVRYGAE